MTRLAFDAAGACALALVELDAASVGPFLLSRPFVIGPLVGWMLGDPWSGAALGVAFETLTLEELPLGGRLDFSAPIAAGIAAWLAAGAIPVEAAFLAGFAGGWAQARVERALRRARSARVRRAEADAAAGGPFRIGTEIAGALGVQAAATFALTLCLSAGLRTLLPLAWPAAPEFLRAGARTAFLSAPWLGTGSLAASLWRRA